ncbi:MAG: DUF4229 domain-containing protein [Frankiales bacterium]|nr:DUF4229 domain-containing protein [Frankiales bacterium]
MTGGPTRAGSVRAVLVYSVARLLLLAGFVVAGWLVGLTGPLLLVLALLASGVVSLFLLQRQRLAMSATVESSVHRLRERAAARTAAEDAYVDRLQEQSEEGRHTEPAQ